LLTAVVGVRATCAAAFDLYQDDFEQIAAFESAVRFGMIFRIATKSTIPADSRPPGPGNPTSCHRRVGLTVFDPNRRPPVSNAMLHRVIVVATWRLVSPSMSPLMLYSSMKA
jgi:hypothetical protein